MSKIYKVVDVSEWQGRIDWSKVKGNVDGALLRCGYGNNLESQDDSTFFYNAKECTRLGIPFGVYFYSYAKNDTMLMSEVAHLQRLIKQFKLSYPVYIDLEQSGTEHYCVTAGKALAAAAEAAGYTAGIYACENWFRNYIKKSLDAYTKWVAKYSSETPQVDNYDAWQYTDSGHIAGISGGVDLSYFYKSAAELTKKSSTASTGTVTAPKPAAPVSKCSEAVKAWQRAMNVGFDTTYLDVDGIWGMQCEKFANTHTLYYGIYGTPTAVKWLQQQLKVEADGIFGPATRAALMAYQSRKGLVVDGVAGIKTYKAMLGL